MERRPYGEEKLRCTVGHVRDAGGELAKLVCRKHVAEAKCEAIKKLGHEH